MRRFSWLAGLVLLCAGSQAAQAHPHVFVDNRLTFLFADGKITGFRTDWRFDEIFTADLINQFDTDGDKQFSAAESQQVKDGTLPNLTEFHYFTYAYVGGKDLGKLEPADFKADIVDSVARFIFTYHLPEPVDPHDEKVTVSIYDHEYYVEVLLAEKDPVALEGDGHDGCTSEVADDPEHAYFGGFVVPQTVTIVCK